MVPERQLKNGTDFVIDDDHSGARRQVCERIASHQLQNATRRLLCCLVDTSELKAILVEDGYLTTSDMKVIASHLNTRPPSRATLAERRSRF
jgi:hypothetical protein